MKTPATVRPTTRPTPRPRPRSTRRQTSAVPRGPAAPGPSPDVPEGLRLLFNALQSDELREYHGFVDPSPYLRVYAALQVRGGDPHVFVPALTAAIHDEFGTPPGDESTVVELSMVGGFWAGVATAWFAMQAFNGQGGAR